MLEFPPDRAGILPAQWLRKLIDHDVIRSTVYKIPESSIQPASLDLRLSDKAHRLRCSFLPASQNVVEKLEDYAMGDIDLRDGAILERNRPYLIPLIEELQLPDNLRAKANPRSSTGRLDIFTRVITDQGLKFDEVRPGYTGRLYLEVVSRSFTIKVKTGISLNQLRVILGRPRCDDEEILQYHSESPLLFQESEAVPPERLVLGEGLFLSVDLFRKDRRTVGYKAKKNSRLLDLSLVGHYDAEDFWEPVYRERAPIVVLEPEECYLLLSLERVRIPPQFAAEMTAYDPTSGELRTHYAGFFDPGFGHDPQGRLRGTTAVLEVRAHDVPFVIEHGQKVCKLAFERMLQLPTILYGSAIGSSYQDQDLTLSKHFRPRSVAQLSLL
jgi:dCTP deaminase